MIRHKYQQNKMKSNPNKSKRMKYEPKDVIRQIAASDIPCWKFCKTNKIASTSGHLTKIHQKIWWNMIPRIASDCKMNEETPCAFKNLHWYIRLRPTSIAGANLILMITEIRFFILAKLIFLHQSCKYWQVNNLSFAFGGVDGTFRPVANGL